MSDLISRSELLKEIEKYKFGAISNNAEREYVKTTILNFIECQPTAYSVDEVVEELEKEAKRWEDSGKRYEDECEIAVGKGLRKAIEIVKQGGVYDNMCEYKIKDKVIYASCNNKQIASAFCWFNECGDYKYCPYCGKKIKAGGVDDN